MEYVIIGLMFIVIMLLIIINRTIYIKYAILMEEKIVLSEEVEEVKDEIEKIKAYKENFRTGNNLYDSKTDHSQVLEYDKFVQKINEEIERKRRREEMSFSVVLISVDFYNEYKQMYKDIEMVPIRNEIVLFMEKSIRKIDVIGYGDKDEAVCILLPMTKAEGASILAERLHNSVEDFILNYGERKIIVTLTISICEVIKSEKVEEIVETLYMIKKEGENRGGNTIKISKI